MIKYVIEKHATAFPSKVLAHEGGAHIYNIQLDSDCDNGNFVGRGDWLGLDLYAEAEAPAVSAIVRAQASNGNYYVEITDATDALFVYQVPMIAEEYSNKFKAESNFYNGAGEVVRAYALVKGDIVEVSKEAFTKEPTVGAEIAAITGKKLTIA